MTILVSSCLAGGPKSSSVSWPKPELRISYQKQDKLVSVIVENIGNAEASYITMGIRSKDGVFRPVESHADFEISTSGKFGLDVIYRPENSAAAAWARYA